MVWERIGGKRVTKKYPLELYFFIESPEGSYTNIYGEKLKKLTFDSFSEYNNAKKSFKDRGVQLYESDIPVEQKVLSKHYYQAEVGSLNTTLFDIEVDYDKFQGHSNVEEPYAPISSIALYHMHNNKRVIFAVPPQYSPFAPTEKKYTLNDIPEHVKNKATVILCKNEKELLDNFLTEIQDTDTLCGWNSDHYDIPYVYKRVIKVLGNASSTRLCFPNSKAPTIRTVEREISAGFRVTDELVRLFGRTAVDYKKIYEKFEQDNKVSYALAYIAGEELENRNKLDYEGSLYDLYREDFGHYLDYNMVDTEIIAELEDKKQYLRLTLQMTHEATGQVDSVYGTIKLAELACINYCHYDLGVRVSDSKRHDYFTKYGGAYVLKAVKGEHKMVGSIDVESLYPTSIICTNISPETLVGQFSDNENAYNEIYKKSGASLSLEYEDGRVEEKTTEEWRKHFIENNYTISGYGTVFDKNKKGFIPAILEKWFTDRKDYKAKLEHYKELLSDMDETHPDYENALQKKDLYYRFQYIKKIQLNSLYGCMGNKFFKFFDIRMAESTTKTGREILLHMTREIGRLLDGEYIYPNKSIVYGDTDSSYFKTHTDNVDDAKRVCRYIENNVNKSFPGFMQEKFFSDPVTSNRVRVENELISDIGIFVTQKIYLLHLVYKDGYDTDEVKIMGHALKKTTLTPIVKERLTDAITEYFKTHDWKKLNRGVVRFKQFLEHEAKLEDYGIPKKVNKVEIYTEKLNNDEPDLRLPGGQAAAIFWNICVEKYEDKESPPISSQFPVKIYYLKKKIGRFSSIAVPADLITVPKWFIDNFVPLIDREKQVEKLVDLTLTNICDAIGKQVPTEKAVLADDLLVY